jgi:DNA invertase Pin-like site-specific DNA recombinase
MLVGYARTSSAEQRAGFEAQLRDLKTLGVHKLFSEQTSAVGPRRELEQALDFVRDGDTLVVTKLDRLARSVADLVRIGDKLTAKGVALRVLGMGIDTATPGGKLVLNIFGSIAQFEREIMLERQREGIAKAKGEGRYKGRTPTARRQADEIVWLAHKRTPRAEIAKQLGIGESSVYRVLAERKAAKLAAKHGMEYLVAMPKAVPAGSFLVHNGVEPTRKLGTRGFRAWLETTDATLDACDCGWASELGLHYRKRRLAA